jgi:hypothetical protein
LKDKSDGDSEYRKNMFPCISGFESSRIHSKTTIDIDLLYVSISLRQHVQFWECIDVMKAKIVSEYLVVACFLMKWGKAECLFCLKISFFEHGASLLAGF